MVPPYGSRLMPTVVDKIAKEQPELPYAFVPLTSKIRDGFRPVTFAELSNATNACASWIDNTIGSSSTFETVAYLGLSDLRYVTAFLAAVKCGYKVRHPVFFMIPFPKYSLCSHRHRFYFPR